MPGGVLEAGVPGLPENASAFRPVVPCRAFDSRLDASGAPRGAGSVLRIPIAGDDAADAKFWPIEAVFSGEVTLAGDHLQILTNWLKP